MKTLIPALGLMLSLSAFAAPISLTTGLVRPESALILNNNLYISNQSGPGTLKDGIGWIQKLDRQGNIIEEKWVDGLNAPKGLRSDGKRLFTADINELVMIDLETKAVEKIVVEGARLLNDVVVEDSGNILVSDTYGQKIFRINPLTKEVSTLIDLTEAPNGLYLDGDLLYIGASGKVNATFNGIEAGSMGNLSSLNLATGEQKIIVKDMGYIDGIEKDNAGTLLVTMKGAQSLSWVNAETGKVNGSIAGVSALASLTDVADLAYDQETGTIYLPNTNSHNVQVIETK